MEAMAQNPVPERPRILISTDIGGTDPDDNQSMTHLLMYSNVSCSRNGVMKSWRLGQEMELVEGHQRIKVWKK